MFDWYIRLESEWLVVCVGMQKCSVAERDSKRTNDLGKRSE